MDIPTRNAIKVRFLDVDKGQDNLRIDEVRASGSCSELGEQQFLRFEGRSRCEVLIRLESADFACNKSSPNIIVLIIALVANHPSHPN